MRRNDWTSALLGALLGGSAAMLLPDGGRTSAAVVAASALIGGVLLLAYVRLDRRFARASDDPRSGGAARARLGLAGAFALRLLTMLPGTLVAAVLFATLGTIDLGGVFLLGAVHAVLAYVSLEGAELMRPPAWVLRLEDGALRRLGGAS